MLKQIRVVMAKPGLDGHDRGIKILAKAYRDAGMEVIYLGLRQTPSMIVNAAIQEDADVIALSILSGAHLTVFSKVMELLKDQDISDILVTGGGIIPEEDMQELYKIGVGKLFSPGSSIEEWKNTVIKNVHPASFKVFGQLEIQDKAEITNKETDFELTKSVELARDAVVPNIQSFALGEPIYQEFNNTEVLFRQKRLTSSENILTSVVQRVDNISGLYRFLLREI